MGDSEGTINLNFSVVISSSSNEGQIEVSVFGADNESYTYGLYEGEEKIDTFTINTSSYTFNFTPSHNGVTEIYLKVETPGDYYGIMSNVLRIEGGPLEFFSDVVNLEIGQKEVDVLYSPQDYSVLYKSPNVLYYQKQQKSISQSSANHTGFGNRTHHVFAETTEDVYASCIFKQTGVGQWYVGGLSVCTERPLVGTHDSQSNGGNVLICAGTGDTTQSQSNLKVRGVDGAVPNNALGKEYLFEVTKIGQTFTSKITEIQTNEVVLNQTKTITNNNIYKYWTMFAFEGCTIEYKDVLVKKI